jgi:streptomycin 3"-adenylyltransferase
MSINAPESIKNILEEFVRAFHEYLGKNLVGIYLHGSLATGGYNPVSSDIDILVVVKKKLGRDEKEEIGQIMLKLSKKIEFHGFEMSIVALDALRHFQYPTPCELRFSDSNKDDFEKGKVDFQKGLTDTDLAAHFVITKRHGICLFGEPVINIFPDIPDEYYLDSIAKDSEWSFNNIMKGADIGECAVPVYGVLNFCRVLAYIREHLVASKSEGGQWAMKHLPQEYRPVIQEAVNEYKKSGSAKNVDCKLLKQFGRYSWGLISKSLETRP